jgi:hypothetical protein
MGLPEDIARLEQDLRELIIRYEQYFCGIEKREPLQLLEEVERCARRYQNQNITNSMYKFKYNSLVATLCVHRQKWTRTNRLIEEGKYNRDRFKMSLHQRNGSKRPEPTRPEAPENPVDRIYQDFRAAREACHLPVEGLSKEKIAAAIAQQKPAIIEKYRCSDVEFAVVIEGGKPRLKARPKYS